MQKTVEGLRHDAAALRTFIEYLRDFCEEQEKSQAYGPASRQFFEYVRLLGDVTLAYLQPFVEEASNYSTNALLFAVQRQKLVAIKKCWSVLHEYIKPAADAHSLTVPTPLVDLLENQAKRIHGIPSPSLVISATNKVNYFQHPLGNLQELAKNLKKTVPNAPDLPSGLVFISIPYTQGSAVFTNAIMFHEFGHFVFHELDISGQINQQIAQALLDVYQQRLSTMARPGVTFLYQTVLSWAQEMFCDLFAISLIGPAYSFASIDLFSLIGELEASAVVNFGDAHPCDALRFREQLQMLKTAKWWDEVSTLKCEHVSLIEELASYPETKYSYAPQPELVEVFKTITHLLAPLVQQVCSKVDNGLTDFLKWNQGIQDAFANGVVPSTIYRNAVREHPSPLAILNATWFFHLNSLDKLMAKIAGRSSENIKDRSSLSSRLEMWAMKAMEDNRLLSNI